MKSLKLKVIVICLLGVTIIGYVSYRVWSYYGEFLYEEVSPNKEFSLRIYKKPGLFEMNFTMPGDSTCRPIWIRLYDSKGKKHNEMLSDDCSLEGKIFWLEHEVLMPDGSTIWKLPYKIKVDN